MKELLKEKDNEIAKLLEVFFNNIIILLFSFEKKEKNENLNFTSTKKITLIKKIPNFSPVNLKSFKFFIFYVA